MILQIQSKNNYLLDILNKNPKTDFGLYSKPLKNGQIIGNAVSKNQYDVVFQDSKYSYLPEESNQIDFQSYCSPLVVLHCCNELFKEQLKSKDEYFKSEIKWLEKTKSDIDNQPCEIKVLNFYMNTSWYQKNVFLLEKYFPNVSTKHLTGKNVCLTVSGDTVFEAMNTLNLVAVLTQITNQYGIFTYIDDKFAQKYARILTNIDNVPYFVFYLFIRRAVKSERQFQIIKPIFEDYFKQQGIDADFVYTNTQESRIDFALRHLELDMPILDVGCGEFKYYKRFMGKGFKKPYFAIDIDKEIEKFYPIMRARYSENNLMFSTNLDSFQYKEKVNILLSEVIEHNSIHEAKKLIQQCIQFNFNKILITTPNSDFNSFYFDEDDSMRHDDHDFELTREEFHSFLQECIQEHEIDYKIYGIGDSINGIQPTQAAILQKRNK